MKFFHVGFFFHGSVFAKELEPTFNADAEDWIRYAPNCWIFKTSRSRNWWADKLNSLIGEADSFVIVEVDPSSHWGFAQEWVWNWFKKHVT